jgi:hypothetical protein
MLAEKAQGKNHSGDLGVDGKIILKWVLKKYFVKWIQLAQDRSVAIFRESGYEFSGFRNARNSLNS